MEILSAIIFMPATIVLNTEINYTGGRVWYSRVLCLTYANISGTQHDTSPPYHDNAQQAGHCSQL